MTTEETHRIVIPDAYWVDYLERCAINRGDGPLTDAIREQSKNETLASWARNIEKQISPQ